MAKSFSIEAVITARDEASKALKGFSKSLRDTERSAVDASKTYTKFLLGATTAVGIGMAGLGKQALGLAVDLEQSKIAFETMLGSAEDADRLLRDLTTFAKRTPFELTGIEQSAKKLLAYGATQDEVLEELKFLGDITAGVGTDKLPQLTLAFGQVRAAGKLTGMELRQFTETGVPLIEGLAEHFGVATSEIQEMVSAGEVGFEDVKTVLQGMTQEGGKFENLMEKQSKSLGGMISNLKDAWDIFLREEGQLLIEWGKQFVEVAIDIVENTLPKMINTIKDLTKFFKEHKDILIIVAAIIAGPVTVAFISWSVAALAAAAATIAALLPVIAVSAAIGVAIVLLKKAWERNFLSIRDVVKTVFEIIKGIIETNINEFKKWKDRIGKALEFIKGLVEKVKEKFDKLADSIRNLPRPDFSGISEGIGNFRSRVGLQHGGVVTRPTRALIGEAGPEAVIPLNRAMPNQAPITINVNGMVPLTPGQRRQVGEIIWEEIQNAAKAQNKSPLEL